MIKDKMISIQRGKDRLILRKESKENKDNENKEDKNIFTILEMGPSFTMRDVEDAIKGENKNNEEEKDKKNKIKAYFVNGSFSEDFENESTKRYSRPITLDDIHYYLSRHNITVKDATSISAFLSKRYPTLELYANRLGYLLGIIEMILHNRRLIREFRKYGFRIVHDRGIEVEVEMEYININEEMIK